MPKQPTVKHPLRRIRDGMGLSIPAFAKRLGVSASIIKKVESRKRAMTQDLSSRVFMESGIMLVTGDQDSVFTYCKEDYEIWRKELRFNEKTAKVASAQLGKMVELMLLASIRAEPQKSLQIFNSLLQAMERIKSDFGLEKHLDAELRDRQQMETKLYKIGELRSNDLLAKMVNFKDSPNYTDEQQLPLSKSIGWMPSKEIFNVAWQHRSLVAELLKNPEMKLSPEQQLQLEQMGKEMDAEITTFMPNLTQ